MIAFLLMVAGEFHFYAVFYCLLSVSGYETACLKRLNLLMPPKKATYYQNLRCVPTQLKRLSNGIFLSNRLQRIELCI